MLGVVGNGKASSTTSLLQLSQKHYWCVSIRHPRNGHHWLQATAQAAEAFGGNCEMVIHHHLLTLLHALVRD